MSGTQRSFPASWPVFTPAHKLANWLESYAESLELNVWTSSTVQKATQDGNNEWDVTVERADGSTRVLHARHIVFAIGLGGNNPFIPEIEGREEFQGQVLHSTAHNSAKDHTGKKVFIVGSATSGECFVNRRVSDADFIAKRTISRRTTLNMVWVRDPRPRSSIVLLLTYSRPRRRCHDLSARLDVHHDHQAGHARHAWPYVSLPHPAASAAPPDASCASAQTSGGKEGCPRMSRTVSTRRYPPGSPRRSRSVTPLRSLRATSAFFLGSGCEIRGCLLYRV